jgi:hypothetical protein
MGFVLPFPYVGQKEAHVNKTFAPTAVSGGGQGSALGRQSLTTISNSTRAKESLLVLEGP